ncbi:MAG: carboxypeptidase regulatory-like domain-containing protein [Acidobacteriota bacterium]
MKKLFTLLVAVAVLSGLSFAQGASSDIYGTVVLPDGSTIPGVAVTLTGEVIGKKVTVTSEQGNFRFLNVPPGMVELKFELEGFKTVIQKAIRLFVGKNKTFNVQMETTKLKEVVEVKGKASAVDTRKTTVSVNVSKEMIQSLPTARNPWTVMNLVPGMMLDREDVGGAESGQQSAFYGHGADSDDTTWNVDGANITDPSAIGAAPAYLNINSYEELQITLGNNDITAQTGGVQLNFVSKRAGNRYGGDFHLYVEDEAWEMSQDLPDYYVSRGWNSPGIQRLYQYGVNFGGPVVKDKLWFFGSYAIQDIHGRTLVGDEDATWLVSAYAKVNFQLGNTSGDFHFSHDAKKKWGRTVLSRAQQDEGSLFDQDGPGYVYSGSLQHVMGNLMLTAKFAYTDGGFSLDPRGADINSDNVNAGNEWEFYLAPREYKGALYHYKTDRNTLNFSLNGNYFAEGVMGGDHEIRFGVDYYQGTTTSQTLYPNQRIAFYLGEAYGGPGNPLPYGAWLLPNGFYNADFTRTSFYASDTATFGKLTINLGVRYDKESGKLNGQLQQGFTWQEPGHAMHNQPMFENVLGDLLVQAGDSPQVYQVISPRLSLTYDIGGDGKNVVKLSVARYGGQSGNSLTSRFMPYREVDVAWFGDFNNDKMINYDEIQTGYYYWWNTDGIDYSTGWIKHQTDADFNSPLLDELSVSFEKAFGDDIAIGVTGFYKKNHNLVNYISLFEDGTKESSANFYASTYTFDDGSTAPIYYRNSRPASYGYYTNFDGDTNYEYMALQFIFSKKYSEKWMLDASFTYADWKTNYNKADYGDGDLTNFDYFNGGVRAPASGGSGLSGVYVNARWQFKLSGLYQLPWGLNATAVFQAREGYVLPFHERTYRGNGLGWTNIYPADEKFGDNRLPTFWMLSLGLEKTFKVSDTVTTTLFVDGYNITNNNTTLLVETNLTAANFNEPLRILNPGIFQFGVRVNF